MILGSITTPSFLLLAIMLVILRSWLGITYTIRGEYYREKARDYVQAARALGVSEARIVFRHVLPNALAPILTQVAFGMAAAVFLEAGMSFLGIGAQPPQPSWGSMLSNSPAVRFMPALASASDAW